MIELAGIYAPATTPFDAVTGDADVVAMRANVRAWLEHPLAGVVLFGSTGEGLLVDDDERARVLDGVRDVVDDGRALLAGVAAESTRAAVRLAHLSADHGADAVLVQPPAYYRPALTAEALRDHFRAVADASPVPVVLYQVPPQFSGIELAAGLVGELAQHPNIAGIKDSTGDLRTLGAYVDACGGPLRGAGGERRRGVRGAGDRGGGRDPGGLAARAGGGRCAVCTLARRRRRRRRPAAGADRPGPPRGGGAARRGRDQGRAGHARADGRGAAPAPQAAPRARPRRGPRGAGIRRAARRRSPVSLGDGLALVAGLALLGVVTLDVHAAVLHHWGSDGPLSGRLSSVFFRLAVGLSRRLRPVTRRRVLGQVGPLMIPLTVALWAALTVVAFALIYLPWIAASFVPDTNVAAPARFADALHFSGVTFFTIGFGDIVPSGRAMRVISVVQGGAGFAFITLVISYFTALYGGYSHQRTAAASLQFQLGPGADASRFIVDHLADPGARCWPPRSRGSATTWPGFATAT
jgi:hypothetical protein